MKKAKRRESGSLNNPWKITSYFKMEKWQLIIISITGIVYNVGMIAGPWFEGQLVQRLFDVFNGRRTVKDMVWLALFYVAVIFLVQLFRFFKRLYVRKFANDVNREMKSVIYSNLLEKSRAELETEGVGNVMTKAISDVDTCAEGMRKFTTEIFDTGVVMISYMTMLLLYDYRLALISFIFPPAAYFIAEKLKKVVSRSASAYKESTGRLNLATIDRVSNAITYRVNGQEDNQNALYENALSDYEKKAIRTNVWETSMQPLYQIVSMVSMIFILWCGAKNVMHTGWKIWDIAAFTTFISCYTKLAVKSSKAARLFNAVQKAKVSWKRIQPFMKKSVEEGKDKVSSLDGLVIKNLGIKYDTWLFRGLSMEASPGEIIGITGPVACGKSSLGKAILGEIPYEGAIFCRKGNQLIKLDEAVRNSLVGYMGHQPELMSDTIENNILFGKKGDVWPVLEEVCLKEEVSVMEEEINSVIGSLGTRLSGGQQDRIALARTLFHQKSVLVLDDPFSAVDKGTEYEIFGGLIKNKKSKIIFMISHRLELFPRLDRIIWIDDGKTVVGTHDELMKTVAEYAHLYNLQSSSKEGETDEK